MNKGFIQKFTSNKLARSSAIVFVGTMSANVLSYLYHLIMGRLLGPSGYGALASLLSLLYIFTVPLTVAQTVIVKFVSGFKAHGEVGQAKSLFIEATKVFVIVTVVGVPIILITGPYITSFLHLSSSVLIMLLYALFVVSLVTVATAGMLNGYQKFIWVGVMGALAILVKLLVSIPLVAWGVPGVMLAAVLASIIVYALYFIPLRFVLSVKARPTKLKGRDMFAFAVPTLLMQLGITSLYSTDIILVRHFFSAHDAGLYAALAILGKIIFYASSAVPIVLFPIASERVATGSKTKKLIFSAVGIVGAISVAITILYFVFPNFIVGMLFGNAYAGAGAMLGLFGIFLGLFSVANIIAMSCLAVGKLHIWLFSMGAAVVQIIGISMFHSSIIGVIYINISVCMLYDIIAGGYYLLGSHEKI